MFKMDIFFIVLFVITITIIVGLNIVTMIDKKISSISVNIPPLNIPEHKMYISIDENMRNMLCKNNVVEMEVNKIPPLIQKEEVHKYLDKKQ